MQTNIKEVREINIFAVVLVIQSLPFIAAVALALLEALALNDFAHWRALEASVERTGRPQQPARAHRRGCRSAPRSNAVAQEQTELAQ